MWCTGLVAPRHKESSQTRDRISILCFGRQIPIHCPPGKFSNFLTYINWMSIKWLFILVLIYMSSISNHLFLKVSVTQLCPTLWSQDCSPLSSSVHGILQARILEWAAISFSRRSSWPRDWNHVSCTAGRFFTTEPPGKSTLWTVACQVPLSMGISRTEYWSGLPWPPPGDFPHPGIEPASPAAPALQAVSLPLSHGGSPNHLFLCYRNTCYRFLSEVLAHIFYPLFYWIICPFLTNL